MVADMKDSIDIRFKFLLQQDINYYIQDFVISNIFLFEQNALVEHYDAKNQHYKENIYILEFVQRSLKLQFIRYTFHSNIFVASFNMFR